MGETKKMNLKKPKILSIDYLQLKANIDEMLIAAINEIKHFMAIAGFIIIAIALFTFAIWFLQFFSKLMRPLILN